MVRAGSDSFETLPLNEPNLFLAVEALRNERGAASDTELPPPLSRRRS